MEIRPAEVEDVDSITELWEELAAHHEALDPFYEPCEGALANFETHVYQVLDEPDALALVCVDDGEVIGYTIARIILHPPVVKCREYCFLDEIVVRPSSRRRGAATLLCEAVEAWARGRGLGRVELNVAEPNQTGLAFWRSLGFTEFQHVMSKPL